MGASVVMLFGENKSVMGRFYNHERVLQMQDGRRIRVAVSFECHGRDVAELEDNEPVEVGGFGLFRAARVLLPGADDSDRVVVELA